MVSEVEVVLPKSKVKADFLSPRKLIIFSKPKVGKTELVSKLEGALIVDLEEGSGFLDAVKYDVVKQARKNNRTILQELRALGNAIKAQNRPYKYIVVDTITKLEDIAAPLALSMYQKTPMGKNFSGDNILSLPNGGGYGYLREAFFKLLNEIYSWSDRTILLAHLKAKYIEKNGKEVIAAELDMTGKIRSITSADVDAIGLLYRESENKNVVSFKTSDDVICGARPVHLKNQEIVISESTPSGITAHWNKIYID